MSIIEKITNLAPPDDDYVSSSRWSASGLGHCKRIQLLKAFGIRPKETPQRRRVLSMCNSIHVDVQNWFTQTFGEQNVECELTVSDPEIYLGGRLDVLIHNNE